MKKTEASATPALAIDNVSKYYAQWQRTGKLRDIFKTLVHPEKKVVTALDGISLEVFPGEFVAYAGANGAGKSTTIKILCGILQPSAGSVSVLGLSPAKQRAELMRRIGIVFGQRTELWWDHPVITSYRWKKTVWDIPDGVFEENLRMVTELLDLEDILHTFSRELSLGQRMRADLGMMLLHSPEVIFLDEPTLGLDVLAKRQMIAFLKQLNRERGTTIVVTSHDMDDLEEMARRIVLLSGGKIAFDGDFGRLRALQGGFSQIEVTTESETPPSIPPLTLVASAGCSHTFAYDAQKTPVREVLSEIAKAEGVQNVEIKKAPIEEVVASLYRSWKTDAAAAENA